MRLLRSCFLIALLALWAATMPRSAGAQRPPQPTPDVQALLDKAAAASRANRMDEALDLLNMTPVPLSTWFRRPRVATLSEAGS